MSTCTDDFILTVRYNTDTQVYIITLQGFILRHKTYREEFISATLDSSGNLTQTNFGTSAYRFAIHKVDILSMFISIFFNWQETHNSDISIWTRQFSNVWYIEIPKQSTKESLANVSQRICDIFITN